MADQGDIATLKGVIETQYITDNTTNDITAERCRQAFDDTIDTLYSEIRDLEGAQCVVEKFEDPSPDKDITFESELKICGNRGTLSAKVNFKDYRSKNITCTDAPDNTCHAETSNFIARIPQDFGGFKWLKPVRYYHVIDEDAIGGDFGAIVFDKFNSYRADNTDAITNEDTTLLLAGNKKGVGRFYDFDISDQLRLPAPFEDVAGTIQSTPLSKQRYDFLDTPGTYEFNYDTRSPFDLSEDQFSIKLLNNKAYYEKLQAPASSTSQAEGSLRIFFEFILL